MHPFAERWNHNTHYFPLLASRIPVSTTRLLDVGCGEGTFCRFVADEHRTVVGVDHDPSVLPASTTSVRYVLGSAETLPFADGSFDAVTMTMVLHHVDPGRALAEAARVLAPGGILLTLGYGRFGGWRDLAHEVRDVVTHRVLSRRMRAWEAPTAKADPSATWEEVRAMAEATLPSSTYRRLPMWRYLVEWHQPSGEDS
ncbi:class I SAM-dependent methyltransferase [Nocardioides mangrovi]|uniref:class I SAM-dependent methyltransferase n=1 Tax=Nocardioides mangrovi TaxID=2874580 RepID=UPI0027DED709|nr:class I SAM-dependent methyltransferase [Nocardioides mangrovi]